MGIKESIVRDQLLENLSILEHDLVPIQGEFRLSSNRGASGWVDILARDQSGMHVLIEVKTARKPTREAMHEVLKYAAIFAEQNGLGPDDVRIILAASDWHELAQSFSEITAHWDYRCDGYLLEFDNGDLPLRAERISALQRGPMLHVCPEQLIYLFSDASARNREARKISTALTYLGSNDHLVISMDYSGTSDRVIFPHCAYIALGVEAKTIANQNSADPWSIQQRILADLLNEVPVKSAEQGSPSILLSMHDWDTRDTIRTGRFVDPNAWHDTILQQRVSGEGVVVTNRFEGKSQPVNAVRWDRLKHSALTAVAGNATWTRALRSSFAFAERADPYGLVELYIYDPGDIVLTLQSAHLDAFDFLPWLRFEFTSKLGHSFTVFGLLEWTGVVGVQDWDDIFAPYGGDAQGYTIHRGTGTLGLGHVAAIASLGLEYSAILERNGVQAKMTWDSEESIRLDRLANRPLQVRDLVGSNPGLGAWIESQASNGIPMPDVRFK